MMIDFSAAASSAAGSTAPNLASISSVNATREPNPNQPTSSILNFRQSSGQSSNNSLIHHNAFGNIGSGLGGCSGPPSALDMNEFPSLGGSISINTFSHSSSIGRQPYVGMVKDNVASQSGSNEFNIQSEDFPALPGASPGSSAAAAAVAAAAGYPFQNNTGASGQDGNSSNNSSSQDHHHHHNPSDSSTPQTMVGSSATTVSASTLSTSLFSSLSSTANTAANSNGNNGNGKKTSIHITKDGHFANIPPGMMNDQYGIAGMMAMLQQADSNPNTYALTIGYDISAINMNLSSKERLYHTFPGPWSEKPLKPNEIDYPVPSEYLVYNSIREKLSSLKLNNFGEDLLFFLFYSFAGESMQAAVGGELYARDWRFHKDECIWITRKPGSQLIEQNNSYERGLYIYFDTSTWSKMIKEMLIKYDRLDGPNQNLVS